MATWGQVNVGSAAPQNLVDAGAGAVLLQNGDPNNTVWLSDDPFGTVAGDTANASPLGPLAFVAVDGKGPVYGICAAGQSAVVSRYGGGQSFFQLVELIVKTLLITGAAGNGEFVYSGAPAAAGLVESVTALDGFDQFGNPYFHGFSSYSGNGALDLFMSLRQAGLFFGTNQNGPGGTGGVFINGPVGLRVQNTFWATDPVAGPPTVEAWHPISLAAGWTAASGQMIPSYRLLPDGNVQIQGSLSHASFTTETTITATPLPAAYRPTTRQFLAPVIAGDAALDIPTSGVLGALVGTNASCTVCRWNGVYPLNN